LRRGAGDGYSAWGRMRTIVRTTLGAVAFGIALQHTAAAATPSVPVFRFYNTQTGTHFYTASPAERDRVVATWPQFAYEGPVFEALPQPEAGSMPVYRFLNARIGTHFYTASASEKDFVVANYPAFIFEGPVFYAAPEGPGSIPLFRFYNERSGAHFYTTSAAERDMVRATWPWFIYEGTSFPVYAVGSAPVTGGSAPPPLTTADAWRLLNQATFGASQAELAKVMKLGIAGWIDDQFDRPVSGYPDSVYNRIQLKQSVDCGTKDATGANYLTTAAEYICWRDHLTPTGLQRNFFTNAVRSSDQLRQRVAWALSQIHVVSTTEADLAVAYPMARYQNLLFEEAFGNFERLLQKVTLSPAMGNYLDMVNNDKPNATTGRVPNENYAREVLQLFAIGLVELGTDGRPLTDAAGKAVATYDQDDIKQFARAFTGWTYPKADGTATTAKNTAYYAAPMVPYPNGHDVDAKALLEGQTLAAGRSALQDTQDAVRNIFLHPNVGPFIGRQLIQRLVTGDPGPAYVARVAAVFNDNGAGVRGDLKAVVRAILADSEARGPAKTDPRFGQLREPVLMITGLLRAMNGVSDGKGLADMAAGLGQRPYASPSVFNYFPPDHTIPGTDILGPEFAIHTSSSAVARANRVYDLVYSGIAIDATVPDATGTRLDILPFEALADNAAALVDGVADALVGGPLPAAARDIVVTAVNAIPVTSTTLRTDRARMAVYLIASSFHFQVQR
jgi:uncharacterized protein (DUF1800 family)